MPILTGMETAKALRKMFGTDRPLLIAMTGGVGFAEATVSGLFDEVLGKPLDMTRLLAVLRLLQT